MDLERINFNTQWYVKQDRIKGAYLIPEYDGIYQNLTLQNICKTKNIWHSITMDMGTII